MAGRLADNSTCFPRMSLAVFLARKLRLIACWIGWTAKKNGNKIILHCLPNKMLILEIKFFSVTFFLEKPQKKISTDLQPKCHTNPKKKNNNVEIINHWNANSLLFMSDCDHPSSFTSHPFKLFSLPLLIAVFFFFSFLPRLD